MRADIKVMKRIRSDWEYDNEPNILTSRPQFGNNFGRTQGRTVFTTAITENDDEKFDDNKLKKLFVRNFKFYENLIRQKNKIEAPQVKLRSRRTAKNDVIVDTSLNNTILTETECYSCYGNSSSQSSMNCYEGVSLRTRKCSDAEHCYTEVNPLYIKRGCILPGRVNRIFVCKCPLCNDKPSFDISHYEYKNLNDWEYDNARLQIPLGNMDLMCKVCETKGTNPTSDKNCRFGKNADYMVCAHNQLCYTNVDDETDFVSRGCMNRPIYNSIYYFCNNTACNKQKFFNPKEKFKQRAVEFKFRDEVSELKPPIVKSFTSKLSCFKFRIVFSVSFVILIVNKN